MTDLEILRAHGEQHELAEAFPILDIFPTCVAAAGAHLPNDRIYDGVDLMPYIIDKKEAGPHNILFWKADHICTVRKGDYKLINFYNGNRFELYNIKDDIGEKTNLAAKDPAKLAELQAMLAAWKKEVNAEIPVIDKAKPGPANNN